MSNEIEVIGKIVPEGCLSRECSLRSLYLRKTLRAEYLERELRKLDQERESYKEMMSKLLTQVNELFMPTNSALSLLKERLSKHNLVKALYYYLSENIINIWIITELEDFETELEVSEILSEVFRVFRILDFDFMIIPLGDMSIEEVLPKDIKGNIIEFSRGNSS